MAWRKKKESVLGKDRLVTLTPGFRATFSALRLRFRAVGRFARHDRLGPGFLLLQRPAGELGTPLVALAAQAGAAAGRALRRRFLDAELQQHQVSGVADPILRQLDDPRVAALAVGELRGDLLEQLLHDLLLPALLVDD